jgi:hypothetical protein
VAWSDTYPKIVATLAAKNGQWSAGVPKLTSADAIGTLAAYVGSLRVGVERATDGICPSSYVDADGIKRINVGVAPSISVAGYISKCTPVGGNAWKRYAADQPLVPSWEPFRDSTYIRNEQSEQLYGVREAMDAYQSAVNAITLGANLSVQGRVAEASRTRKRSRFTRGESADEPDRRSQGRARCGVAREREGGRQADRRRRRSRGRSRG